MSLKIEHQLKKNIAGFITEKRVKKLLRIVPKEHILGLDKIVILNEIVDKKKNPIGGAYRQKANNQPCSVELAMNVIYKGMPGLVLYLPFAATFLLADVLYHEIGHHYYKIYCHGIKKSKQEDFVGEYSKEMLKKKFRFWLYFFLPLTSLIKYLHRHIQIKERARWS